MKNRILVALSATYFCLIFPAIANAETKFLNPMVKRSKSISYSSFYREVCVIDTNKLVSEMLASYMAGKRDSAFLRRLSSELIANDMPIVARQVGSAYYKQLRMPLLLGNLNFLSNVVLCQDQQILDFFVHNLDLIRKIMGRDDADLTVLNALIELDIKPFYDSSGKDIEALKRKLESRYQKIGTEAVYMGSTLYALNNPLTHRVLFEHFAPRWFREFAIKRSFVQPPMLNSIAWGIFENSNKKNMLEFAAKLSEHSIKSDRNAFTLDTYSNILYKLGRTNEALKFQEEALNMMPDNEDIKSNYKKMQASIPTWPTAEVVNFDRMLSLKEVLETAKSTGKFILIDFMATWCGPCKEMDKYVYSDKAVGKILNDRFINVKFQTDSTSNDSEYVKSWHKNVQPLTSKYEIKGFPTIVFLSPEGKLIKKIVGYTSSSEFLKSINEVLEVKQ